MGWLYVPGLRASNSDSSSPSEIPIAPSVTWKGKPLRPSYWPAVWKKAISKWRLSGTISNPSMAARGVESWISSARDSLASQSLALGSDEPKKTSDGFGLTSLASFARYDRESSRWKTYQGSLFADSETFSESWPPSGSMRSGCAFERRTLERRTFGAAFSFWPGRERDALRLLTERGEGSARPTEPWDGELGHVGEELANSSSGRRGELRQSSRQAGLTKRDGEALANSERTERWALDESGRYLKKRCNGKRETSGRARELREAMGDSHDERRQTREWDLQAGKPDADGASSAVADTDSGRCESERSDGLLDGERAALNADRCLSPFPPGPDEDWGGIEESAQPAIRRVADGLPLRLDRLCALGNGVVPVVAAKAFLALAERALR